MAKNEELDVRELLARFKSRVKSNLDSVKEETGKDYSLAVGTVLEACILVADDPDLAIHCLDKLLEGVDERVRSESGRRANLMDIRAYGLALYHIVTSGDEVAKQELIHYAKELSRSYLKEKLGE